MDGLVSVAKAGLVGVSAPSSLGGCGNNVSIIGTCADRRYYRVIIPCQLPSLPHKLKEDHDAGHGAATEQYHERPAHVG